MTMRAAVARGALALGATRIVINIAALGSLVVVARLLTPEDFGVVAIATTLLGIIMAVTELSVGSALVQRTEVTQQHIDSAWSLAFLRSAVMAAAFAGAALPLAGLYGDERLAPVFILSGATGAISGLINPKVMLKTKDMRFAPMLGVQLAQKLVGLAAGIALALWLRNYWAVLIGNAIGAVTGVLLSYVVAPYLPRFTLARARDIMGFSGWLFLGQVVTVLNWRFDHLLFGFVLTRQQLGTYSMADSVAAIPSREVTTPFVQALFPGFSAVNGEDTSRLRRAYGTAQAAIGMIALPAGFGLAVIADPLVRVALGEKWLAAVPLIQIIAACYAVQTLAIGVRPLAMARGDTRSLFWRELLGLGMRIPLVTVGLLLGGMVGAAWGRAVGAVVMTLIAFRLVREILGLGIGEQVWAHRRTLAATIAMSGVVLVGEARLAHLPPEFVLALLLPLGGLVYVSALGLLWVAEGRRPGPETELIGLARGVVAKSLSFAGAR